MSLNNVPFLLRATGGADLLWQQLAVLVSVQCSRVPWDRFVDALTASQLSGKATALTRQLQELLQCRTCPLSTTM